LTWQLCLFRFLDSTYVREVSDFYFIFYFTIYKKKTGAVRLQGTGAVRLQGTGAVRLQGTGAVRLQETGAVCLQRTLLYVAVKLLCTNTKVCLH